MVKGGGDAGGGVRVGVEGDEGNPWWMCEKERDQLIGKIDCEGERERKKGSVYVCVCVEKQYKCVLWFLWLRGGEGGRGG